MATANTKSTIVTQADAADGTKTPAYLKHGRVREQAATVEVAAADDNASVYRLFRAYSSWRISEILLWNDAITGGSAYDLGVYQTADNGAAVVDADEFASLIDMQAARTDAPLHATFEAHDIADIEKRLWEVIGETEDPQRFYDICLTGTTVGTGAGTISGVMRYVDGT